MTHRIDLDRLPTKLRELLRQPGERIMPGMAEFLECVRSFALEGVGYGFMMQAVEWEWQDVCERQGLPGSSWGPEYFEGRIRELEAEVARLKGRKA